VRLKHEEASNMSISVAEQQDLRTRLERQERSIEKLIEKMMRNTIADLSIVSEASAGRIDRDRVHGGTRNNTPRGARRTLADIYWNAYESAEDSSERIDALERAKEALIAMKYGRDRTLTAGTLEWRQAIAADERPANVVAHVYGCSRQTVYRLRQEARKRSRRPVEAVGACKNCWTTGVPVREDGTCDACQEFRDVRASGKDPFEI
jgi:hypothetical protein